MVLIFIAIKSRLTIFKVVFRREKMKNIVILENIRSAYKYQKLP